MQLTIGNSYSRITGLSAEQERILRAELSYMVGGSSAYFSKFGAKRQSLLDKRGYFPTGLLSRLSVKWLVSKVTDERICPKTASAPFLMKGDPYEWQLNAVKAAETYHRGIISAPTGTGKSMAMALLISRLNVKTLVVVPSLEIKKQLQGSVGHLPNVRIENIDSSALKTLTDFDCLIIDEGHHVAAKTYRKLNKTAWTNIYYRFFFTATPFRNDTEETLLFESIAGSVIYSLDYKTAVRDGYIVPVEAYSYSLPKQSTDAYTYAEVYKELVVNNVARNTLIAKVLTNLHSSGKSTLCLVKEVKHGEILSDITGLPFVSGADDTSRRYIEQFNKGNIKVLIATTGIMGEGIDSKPCEFVVIAGLGKAKSHFQQQIGRGVRKYENKESCKVILFRDASHKFCLRHYNAQVKILKEEYWVKCYKLEGP